MKKIIILLACVLLSIQLFTIKSVLEDIKNIPKVEVVEYVPKKTWVKSEVIKMIAEKAIENDLNPHYLIKLAECESGASSTIQSRAIQKYGREQSFGVFQIHTYAHKDITIEQAKDPIFNTEWAIERIKQGKASRDWVHCHKKAISVI